MASFKREFMRYLAKKVGAYWVRKNAVREEVIDFFNIHDSGYITSFNDIWRSYTDYPSPEMSSALKKNMDIDSIKTIDAVISAHYIKPKKSIWDLKWFNLDNPPYPTDFSTGDYKEYYSQFAQYDNVEPPEISGNIYYDAGAKFLPEDVAAAIKDGVIFDCGAFDGDTALIFLKYQPKHVYTFEPVEHLYNDIMNNSITNKLEDKITPVQCGISDKKGQAEIHIVGGSSTIHKNHFYDDTDYYKDSAIINLISIDEYVNDNNVIPKMIKMDIEGNESNAIVGAKETITKHKPILLISLYHNAKDFFEIKPLLETYRNDYNYKIRAISINSYIEEVMLIAY